MLLIKIKKKIKRIKEIIKFWPIVLLALLFLALLFYGNSFYDNGIVLNNKITGFAAGYVRQEIVTEPKVKVCETIDPLICKGDILYSQTITPECRISKRIVKTCPGGCVDGECVQNLVGQAIQVEKPEEEELEKCNNDAVCDEFENFESCPNDCSSGGHDGLCDGQVDDICDADCVDKSNDTDCMTFWRKFVDFLKTWLFGSS